MMYSTVVISTSSVLNIISPMLPSALHRCTTRLPDQRVTGPEVILLLLYSTRRTDGRTDGDCVFNSSWTLHCDPPFDGL
jgi:hypothetical protein